MVKFVLNLLQRIFSMPRKGAAMFDYGIIVGLIAGGAIALIALFSDRIGDTMCRGANAVGMVNNYLDESCPVETGPGPEDVGFSPEGFVDLHLERAETEIRQVLLPVDFFDIAGLDDIHVATNRADSVSACYEKADGQVVCASMSGLESAYSFPPDAAAVGYKVLPDPEIRHKMAQPIAITLGSLKNPSLNQTWNIKVYRDPSENLFEPEMSFESIEYPVGTVGSKKIIQPLRGEFSSEPLIFTLTPEDGQFGICQKDTPRGDAKCGLISGEQTTTTISPSGVNLGYQFMLPRDVRIPVSWPVTISMASSFNEAITTDWDIVISRPAGEAPEFHELPFEDYSFPADTWDWNYYMLPLDQEYPSALLVTTPQSEEGLKVCYRSSEEATPICSPDVSTGDVEFVVPAGSFSMGLGVKLPDNVLNVFTRKDETAFTVKSLDYPDFSEDFSIRVDRPAFVPIFEPEIVFEDKVFPQGDINWHPVLADMAGNFNSANDLIVFAGQPNAKACFKGTTDNPDANITCAAPADTEDSIISVPLGAKEVGISVDFGDSPFQPVDTTISFELRNSKDVALFEGYSVNVTRPNIPVVFEPNMETMILPGATYPEEAEDWQEAVLIPLDGEFNTDLELTMPGGINDAAACFQVSPASIARCTSSALTDEQSIDVPNDAYSIGYRVKLSDNFYIDQDMAIEIVLTSPETDAYSQSFTAQTSREPVPVVFDPNLGFRDKIFDRGAFNDNHVMVPIEGEFSTALKMTADQSDFHFKLCQLKTAGGKPICTSDAQYGNLELEVDPKAVAVGYEVFLPKDVHVDWTNDAAFKVMSEYDESLEYEVAIALSRETIPPTFTPDAVFEDITFDAGTTGAQLVMQDLTGIETGTSIRIQDTGLPISACLQKYATGGLDCDDRKDGNELVQEVKWNADETKANRRLVHSAGYEITLPDDIHKSVEWSVSLQLVSTYDPSKTKSYQFRIMRPAVDVVWEPDADMVLPDVEFPVRTSGPQDVFIPFKGNFTTDTEYTIGQTASDISACFIENAESGVKCGSSSQASGSTVTLIPDAAEIGYRVDLPADLAEDFNKTVQVVMQSAYDPSLTHAQSFTVYREPAPVVFNPDVTFQDRKFINGESGWQQEMTRLGGDLTTTLELHFPGGKNIKLCVQKEVGEDVICTGEGAREKVLEVPPTANAIGYEVKLPDDVTVKDVQSFAINLRMKDYPSQYKTYQINTLREMPDDLVFEPTVTFGNPKMPTEWHGWTPFTVPLTGEFSGEIEFVLKESADDLKACIQAQSSGDVVCEPAPKGGILALPRSTYAFGYAVDIADTPFENYSRKVPLRLQSAEMQGLGQDYNPTVSRPALPVELPRNLFTGTKEYNVAEQGVRTEMAQINGVGNTAMRFDIFPTGSDIYACIQRTSTSEIVCSSEPANTEKQSFDFDADTYALGYRITLPEDPFEVFNNNISMTIISTEIEDTFTSFGVTVNRPVQQPIMPSANLFADTSYRPGETGQQEVMAVLSNDIDTPLKLSKAASRTETDISVCYQLGRNSPVVCEGKGSNQGFEIVDVNDSWYAVGYRFDLDQNVDNDVDRTIPLRLTSTRVPQSFVAYNIKVSRLKLNAVMPDRTLFSDRTFEVGEEGDTTVMVPIAKDINVDMALHKKAGQPGLDICYQRYSTSAPYCTGKNSTDAVTIQVNSDYHAVGYKFKLGSKYQDHADTFNLMVTSADGWSNQIDYEIDVFRAAKQIELPPENLFADVTLGEDDIDDQLVMVPFKGQGNTDIEMIKAAGQRNLALCSQETVDSKVNCSGSNNDGEVIRQIPEDTYKIGYEFNAGTTPYEPFQSTHAITLRVKGAETEEVAYSVDATRPAKEVIMPSATLFQDIEFPAGTTGNQYVMKDIVGKINGRMMMANDSESGAYKLCRQEGGVASPFCPVTTHSSDRTQMNFTVADEQVGFMVPLPSYDVVDYENVFTFTLTSREYGQLSQEYSVRVYRPGTYEEVPLDGLFADVTVPSSTTGSYSVMRDIGHLISSDMTMRAAPDATGYKLCMEDADDTTTCPRTTRGGASTDLNFPSDTQKVGFDVPLPDDIFEVFDKNFSFQIFASDGTGEIYDFNIRIHRPKEEPLVPPASLFGDVDVPVETTGTYYVWESVEGLINSDMKLRASSKSTPYGLCVEYINSTTNCTSLTSYGWTERVVPKDAQKVGFSVAMPSNVYTEFNETFAFEIRSQENTSKFQSYAVPIHRPGAEIKIMPANLFVDVNIPVETTGTYHDMKSIEGLISSNMEAILSRQDSSFTFCRTQNEGNAPYCPITGHPNYTFNTPFYESDLEIGVGVSLPSNVYEEFNKTVTFIVRSKEDTSKSQTYTIRYYRPGAEIKTMPAGLFVDVDIPVETTGTYHDMKSIEGLISSNMEAILSRQDSSFTFCRTSKEGSAPYCPMTGHPNYTYDAPFYESDLEIGVGVSLPSNVYEEFNKTVTFIVRSKEDTSKSQTYTIRYYRPGAEIKTMPAGLFVDVDIPVETTGTYHDMKSIEGLISSNMEAILSRQDSSFSFCRTQSEGGAPHCPITGHPNYTFDAPFYESDLEIGVGVSLPSNVYEEFNKTVTFIVRSKEDTSKSQTYTIRYYRPGAEIKTMPAGLFVDVDIPVETTGTYHDMKSIEGLISSNMEAILSRQDSSFTFCRTSKEGSAPYCPIRGHPNSSYTTPFYESDIEIGVGVSLPSNVYEEFNKTVTFIVRSKEDTSNSQTYTIRFYRPGKEIKVLPSDFFQDVSIPAGTTGDYHVMKDIRGLISSGMEIYTSRQPLDFWLCREWAARGGVPYCSTQAHPSAVRTITFPENDVKMGIMARLPSDTSRIFDRTITFTVRSVENASKSQTYAVRFYRPALN